MISLENLYLRLYKRELLLEKMDSIPMPLEGPTAFIRENQVGMIDEVKFEIEKRLNELRQEAINERNAIDSMPEPTEKEMKELLGEDIDEL